MLYDILREDCSVKIDQMQATVGSRGLGHSSNKRERLGRWGMGELRRDKKGWLEMGQSTTSQTNGSLESPHQSPSKRTQCMRRNKATPGAREDHFLFEESVLEQETAEEGSADLWRLLRGRTY